MGLCLSTSSGRTKAPAPTSEPSSPRASESGASSTDSSGRWARGLELALHGRAPQRTVPTDIPPRPRAKISALAETTQRAEQAGVDADLVAYAREALEQAEWQQADTKLSQLDRQHLPALTAECNRRHPGLNAVAMHTQEAFMEHLARHDNPPAWRALLQVSSNSLHRIAVDVRHHPDGSHSLILLDASRAYDRKYFPPSFLQGYGSLFSQLRSQFGERCRLAVIEADAQKSLAGCTIYSVSHAMELHRHEAFFDELHDRLRTQGRCLAKGHAASEQARGVELVDGRAVLPASFYKHAHARSTVDEVVKKQGATAQHQDVSTGSGTSETIGQRVQDYRVTRDVPEEDSTLSYSMSIETARMTKIRHALETAIEDRESRQG